MFKTIARTSATVLDNPPVFYNATMDGFRASFCVYEIWIGTELVYLGCCKFALFPSLPDAANNSEFTKLTADGTEFNVRIVATGNKSDCMNYRVRLARQLPNAPRCNKFGTIGRFTGIQCIEDGKVYRTQTEAAQAYSVSQGNMSNHIRGVNGYGTIGGKTFRRVAL